MFNGLGVERRLKSMKKSTPEAPPPEEVESQAPVEIKEQLEELEPPSAEKMFQKMRKSMLKGGGLKTV